MASASGSSSGNLTPATSIYSTPAVPSTDLPEVVIKSWLQRNTSHFSDYSLTHLAELVKAKSLRVIVIIPAREVSSTIAGVINSTVKPLVNAGIVSKVYAIDAQSKDGTGAVASQNGATVLQRAGIASEYGPSQGKGDAMWRGLFATHETSSANEIVAFLDGDTGDPSPAHLIGIIGPLIMNDDFHMVRGFFERPFKSPSGEVQASNGGRVTELTARPLLNLHFPDLAGFSQPLAGEFAARRHLLEQLSFPVGYGVEIATLIDSWRLVGLGALAQCDLGTRQNAHKSLRDLTAMAFVIAGTIEDRRERTEHRGGAKSQIYLPWDQGYKTISRDERPPLSHYLQDQMRSSTGMATLDPAFKNIDGVANFRDIGGYSAGNGNIVRRNFIYRSADMKKLTPAGRAALEKLSIRDIFDLRSTVEVQKAKLGNGEAVLDVWKQSARGPSVHLVPIFDEQDYSPESLAKRFKDYASEGTEGFERAYMAMLQNSRIALTLIVQHLANSPMPPPIIIHCTAGKDRTGVITMVLLLLAGCPASTIAREYALTQEGLGPAWRADAVQRLSLSPVFQGQDKSGIERMIAAREDVMLAVIKKFELQYGTVERYLTGLGISEKDVKACEAALTSS